VKKTRYDFDAPYDQLKLRREYVAELAFTTFHPRVDEHFDDFFKVRFYVLGDHTKRVHFDEHPIVPMNVPARNIRSLLHDVGFSELECTFGEPLDLMNKAQNRALVTLKIVTNKVNKDLERKYYNISKVLKWKS